MLNKKKALRIIGEIKAGKRKECTPTVGVYIIYIYSLEVLQISKIGLSKKKKDEKRKIIWIEAKRVSFDGKINTNRYTAKKNGKLCLLENALIIDTK